VADVILAALTSEIVSCTLEDAATSGIRSGDGAQVISSSGRSPSDELVVVRGKLEVEPASLLWYPSEMPCQHVHLVDERSGRKG